MAEPLFPSVPQPEMRQGHMLPHAGTDLGAIIDNRTGLPDDMVREVVRDKWVEVAGLQFAHPSSFQMYSSGQGSMLARMPFRTPQSVIDEIRLARTVADTDDDIGAAIGQMTAIAFGEGVVNQHRDEKTLEFFNEMTKPKRLDLVAVLEEMYRELLIAGSVTTLTIFSRNRLQYWPLKSEEPVQAQLQVPNVAVLPAENLRVVTNDIMGGGQLAYHVEDPNLRNWLNEYLDPRTNPTRQAIMAMQEPVAAALFTGRYTVPFSDGDPMSRGMTLYTLNQQMIQRTCFPKGANPYPRPLLTRNFGLLEAKRLLNLMDYALLQGGTNYIVVAKKGSDQLPAQQGEVDNLVEQVRHASRSGVMVGDHRMSIEIITPKLDELLNPNKRKLVGRKLKMGLMRQTEEVPGDTGTQGGVNEMELTARVVSSDRRKIVSHAQASFYDDTAQRNRSVFPMGAPNIWAPKIILSNVAEFWQNLLQARDRGDIPRRWVVEALGYDYDAALAEREREIARGDDDILMPAAVPFSNPGEPQDNGPGRPVGSSSNNGRGVNNQNATQPAQAHKRKVIARTAGETVTALVENGSVFYVGELTAAVLDSYGERADFAGYVTEAERDAIDFNQTLRVGSAVIVPVNPGARCTEFSCVKLEDGLRMVVGKRIGDDAMLARALRFQEPKFDLRRANEYAIRWGFLTHPVVEETARGVTCANCGTVLDGYPNNTVCPECGSDNTPGGVATGHSNSEPSTAELSAQLTTLTASLADLAARPAGVVDPGQITAMAGAIAELTADVKALAPAPASG